MKKLIKKFSIVFMVLSLGISSCSNDDDASSPEPSPAELLANKWYFVQTEDLTTTPPSVTVADACQQTSYLNFTDDGNLVFELFALNMAVCESQALQAYSYDINASGTTIFVTDGATDETWPIETLTESALVIIIGSGNVRLVLDR